MLLTIAFYCSLPKPLFKSTYSTVLYDSQNKLLNAKIAVDGQWRFPYTDSIPNKFKVCLVEFEDKHFYHHFGVNFISLCNAAIKNFKKSEKKTGGSTLTMQLARLSRGNPSRTYTEKLIEIIIATRIECSYSKQEIINYYSCNAPFGGNVVGLHAASWRYFGRDPKNLSWSESALLAVLPNAPSLIYPGKNHNLLIQKRNRLLQKLYNKNIIDKLTYELALQENIPDKPIALPQLAAHLLQRASKENGEGKIFYTTINSQLQERCKAIIDNQMLHLKSNQINNACAIILDTKSGNVLAYIGNTDSENKEDNNDVDIISSSRSSGSLLKPILYASLLNEGKITPNSLIEDIPTQIGSYAPKNFNLTYDGLVPANEAIARSLNVPAVKMLQQYGTAPFLFQLRKLGFTTIQKGAKHYGLSLILGGAEVSPWEVASVYASLGRTLTSYNRYGTYSKHDIRPANYLRFEEKKIFVSTKNTIINAGCIWQMLNSMTELVRPDEYSGNSIFSSTSKIAWKTGTSFGFRDAWAVGLNQKYTVVVWIGNADGEGRPGLTGINVAAPLMFSIFNILTKNEWFSKPIKNLTNTGICSESGCRASEICPNTKMLTIPFSTLKSTVCSYHKIIHCDSTGQFQVNSNCYPVIKMKHLPYFVLSPIQEFFYKKSHLEFNSSPAIASYCIDETTIANFDLIYPRNGFKIYLPLDENGKKNDLIMNATHKSVHSKLYWYLDKEYIGETSRYHQISVKPNKGRHELVITEEKGKSIKVYFDIIEKK